MSSLSFLSDYGYADEFVGVVHGVIACIHPEGRVIDITHGIERHDVRAGALALRAALPFCPAGVHLAVVDPHVGASERRAVALRCAVEERLLVGPDNGLLTLAAEHFGGVVEAVEISHSPHRLEPVSATFHGRDIFAPVAAHLAAGAPLQSAGEPMPVNELIGLELPVAQLLPGSLMVHALAVDRFGNVMLNARHDQLSTFGLKIGAEVWIEVPASRVQARYVRTYADVESGGLLLYEDSHRTLSVGLNRGSAADFLGLKPGDELRLCHN